jgi:hypothetical protein
MPACVGSPPGTLDDQPFGEAARHAQERLFFNQLAREILTNLGHIEQGLDSYFRNPNLRDNLASLANPLKQIEGAFAVLGDNQALELVANNAKLIADLLHVSKRRHRMSSTPSRTSCLPSVSMLKPSRADRLAWKTSFTRIAPRRSKR